MSSLHSPGLLQMSTPASLSVGRFGAWYALLWDIWSKCRLRVCGQTR